MSNEKQNLVEWLEKQNDKLFISYQKGFMSAGHFIFLQHKLFKQAKEMYRKELELAYEDGKEIRHILNTIQKNQQ